MSFHAICDATGMGWAKVTALFNEYWEKEVGISEATADSIRKKETARLTHVADVNYHLATNPKIKVTKEDPDAGTMDLADFEKVTKASANFIKAVAEIAKYNGCYRPQEVAVTGSLSVSQLAKILEASEIAEGQ